MRKPAKLKSAKEALTKMLDGVVFFYCDSRIYWDEEEIQFSVSYVDSREKEKLNAFLENYGNPVASVKLKKIVLVLETFMKK